MRFHFVRHGKRDRKIGDPSLTVEGRDEAEVLAKQFVLNDTTQIFSSPLARTRETAEIIARVLDLEVVVDARLRERMNWGDLEGQSFDDFITEWERCSRERDYQPQIGDSSIDAGRRVEAFVSDCYHQMRNDTVICVTHGGVLADFLLNVFSFEELHRICPSFCDDPYSGNVIQECSVTSMTYDGNQYQLEAIGAILIED